MAVTLGVLTIGQTPRSDGLMDDIQRALGPDARIVGRGALDGLSNEEVAQLEPSGDEYHMITRLRDGTAVKIAKQPILDRLQAQIDELERNDGVDGTLLVCTGEFPDFQHGKPLLKPQASLYGVVSGLANSGRVGALIPLPSQRGQASQTWASLGLSNAALADADPYGDDPIGAVESAASRVRSEQASVLFMDCFGYDAEMADAARDAFGGPVVLARSMAARIAAELIS